LKFGTDRPIFREDHMTIRKIVRRVALAAMALSATAVAYAAPEADMRALPPDVRDAVVGALNKGDYDSAGKLLQNMPVSPPQAATKPDSRWETLKGCGFYPQQTRLECTVEISEPLVHVQRPFGPFGGPVGGWGSQENVDFCVNIVPVDFNLYHMTIWMPVGRGTVIVHDQRPAALHNPVVAGPWDYAVYRDFDPIAGPRVALNGTDSTQTTSQAFTYEVKAILWWNAPLSAFVGPSGDDPAVNCTFVPVYGDIKIFQVRGDPIR
jgi:hypothetical protein